MFTFRGDDHTYWLDDVRLTGVTESLARVGVLDATHYDDTGTHRGRDVHEWCKHFARKGDDLPPPRALRGYCRAFERMCAEARPTFHAVEDPLHNPSLQLAGTTDAVLAFAAPGYPTGLGIGDWKTGAPEDWHQFQLALYAIMAEAAHGPITWGVDIYLQDTGKWRPKFVQIDARLRRQAHAFLSSAQWLIAHR